MIIVRENEAGQNEKERNAGVAQLHNLAFKYAARDACVVEHKDIQGSKKAKRCQGFKVLDSRVRRCVVADDVVHLVSSPNKHLFATARDHATGGGGKASDGIWRPGSLMKEPICLPTMVRRIDLFRGQLSPA